MAVGKTSKGGARPTFYVGVAPVKVLAVNPTAKQIEELMGYAPKQEPTYVGEREIDNKKIKTARVSFIIETVGEPSIKAMPTFFLDNRVESGTQSGKLHVIDNYVRDCWVTPEDLEAKKVPVYSNGPARVDAATMHKVRVGEIALTKFFQTFLKVPQIDRWDSESRTFVHNDKVVAKEDCILTLDNVKDYFAGNFDEIKDLLALQPDNSVKMMFGVRYDNDGNLHQEVYTNLVISDRSNSLKPFENELAQQAERLNGRVYEACALKEYVVEASTAAEVTAEDDDNPIPPQTEDTDW